MTKPKETTLEPLRYDPSNPELTVLHRAGLAGLLLQIKAMEELRNEASEEEKQQYVIPQLFRAGQEFVFGFTEASFYSVMRERYRATWVEQPPVSKERDKPKEEKSTGKTEQKAKKKKVPQLKMGNFLDWSSFILMLGREGSMTSPSSSRRILELLPDNVRTMVLDAAQMNDVKRVSKTKFLAALNDILKSRDFYEESYFEDVDITDELETFLESDLADLSDVETQRFNRLLLDASYPQEIERSKAGLTPPKRYICKWPRVDGKFVYLDPKPSLRYFEVFGANKDWQEHAGNAAWKSYYSIPRSQLVFKLPSDNEKNNTVDKLWGNLLRKENYGLRKQFYPAAFDKNLKGKEITESSELALLLHFWPLVAAHFTPVNLKVEKDKKSGKRSLINDYQAPVIVVPDVVDVGRFVDSFIDRLGSMGDSPKGKVYEDARYIATPLEASLAFFVAPRLARGSRPLQGTRGAEVYVFRKPKQPQEKQPLVATIVKESFEPEQLAGYNELMEKKIFSMPFRALCVESFLAQPQRHLYEGFERLVELYPLELFIATKQKDKGERHFEPHGYQMAHSLRAEFKSIEENERRRKLKDEKPAIPYLIWRITRDYIHWRACAKAEPPIENPQQVKALLAKKAKQFAKKSEEKLTADEEKILNRYYKAVGDVVEKQFIDFRGMREDRRFANAFTETFFRAPQNVTSEEAERLQPFYEGERWESGRRLVLMAISAAGARASFKLREDSSGDITEGSNETKSELGETNHE